MDEKYRMKDCETCRRVQAHPKSAIKFYEKGGGVIIDEEAEEKEEEEEMKKRAK